VIGWIYYIFLNLSIGHHLVSHKNKVIYICTQINKSHCDRAGFCVGFDAVFGFEENDFLTLLRHVSYRIYEAPIWNTIPIC
jgi:hypothetical protein